MKLLRALAVGLLVLSVAPHADAHRLDEFLQQTMIEIDPGRIVLRVDLTPGVAVATDVLSAIDTDGDGRFSTDERAAYTELVRKKLELRIDDAPVAIRVIDAKYPTVDGVLRGLGTIDLSFEASVPQGAAFRSLSFENHHAPSEAAYLVNCLTPREPLRIASQTRSRDQASYRAELVSGSPRPAPRMNGKLVAGMVVVVSGLLYAVLRLTRRLRQRAATPVPYSLPGSR